jgi:dihydrolipoamide dehydrogenase
VWNSFGSEVTIIEGLAHLIALEDESSSKQLERAFRKRGINSI